MLRLVLITLSAAATTGAAQAQVYGPGPRPAYAAGGWNDADEGCGSRLTLLGGHAGVTVLGVDVGASAGLHVGLHDRCGGRHSARRRPEPAEYGPPEEAYGPQTYGPPQGYGDRGYPVQMYAAPAYGGVSGGYAYSGPATYSYGWPCGC